MQVCVVGAGYVGLVTGACLADTGHSVVLVDLDPSKIDAINGGRAPIHEAGLPDLLARTVGRTLRATTELAPEIRWSDGARRLRLDAHRRILRHCERAGQEEALVLAPAWARLDDEHRRAGLLRYDEVKDVVAGLRVRGDPNDAAGCRRGMAGPCR